MNTNGLNFGNLNLVALAVELIAFNKIKIDRDRLSIIRLNYIEIL